MTEPKELRREELASIAAHHSGKPEVDLLLGHIAALEQEEHFLHRLNTRQAKLLTGVVNAIRGEPDSLTLWSHHDAPDLAQRAMRVVRAARAVLDEYNETLRLAARQCDADESAPNPVIRHLADMLQAYEQLTERHEPLSTPGVELPGWQETFRKVEAGVALNPIEALICRLTPGDNERAADFRRMLRAALDYTAQQAKAVRS